MDLPFTPSRRSKSIRSKVFGVITKDGPSDHAAIALFKRYGIRYGQDVQISISRAKATSSHPYEKGGIGWCSSARRR